MKNLSVARRYAKAVFELAVETKSVDDVLQGLGNLCLAIEKDPFVAKVLHNPLLKPHDKQKIVSSVTSNKLIAKLTALLAKRRRLDLLSAVYEQFAFMNDASKDIRRPLVKTAVPLTEAQRKAVEEKIAKTFGGMILGKFEVAKDLIGGVWIQLGEKVLDASIKGRIEDFRHALVHSAN